MLVPSLDLFGDLARIDIAYTTSRMALMERLPGNPLGVGYRSMGDVVALRCRVQSRSYNRIVGLGPGDDDLLEPLLTWYEAAEAQASMEITPGRLTASLARRLHDLGFWAGGFHATVGAVTAEVAAGRPTIPVEAVRDAESLESFLDIYFDGWSFPPQIRERASLYMRGWLGQPHWSLYVARCDGTPAAAAILYVRDGIGYLADSTTRPSMRGQGLHAALLQRRIADAADAGATIVFGQAAFLSSSYRNMLRAGLCLLYNQALWTSAG